jgi:hypothetical protein
MLHKRQNALSRVWVRTGITTFVNDFVCPKNVPYRVLTRRACTEGGSDQGLAVCGGMRKISRPSLLALAKVPTSYPDIGLSYILPLPHPTSSFPLHTYLVGETAIKKAVFCGASPTLHIVATSFVEWLSGPSSAKFLMVYLALRGPFHQTHHLM